ncbi:MAG: ribosome silencing factor [Schleiferiaceae bacterium]|jgi:ribosome-associated protein|nr:ribosome silencing factor [Schleiferiaceae bacterium]MDP4833332.1 ribosome silencing factor [Schleiferiaceae bacterium]
MTATFAELPQIVRSAIEGVSDIKGENLVLLDLRGLDNAVCDFFIVAEAQSTTQVNAMADAVHKRVREEANDKPWHVEGAQQSEWVLMDYVSTVVHLFQREARAFYDLEGLWADAPSVALPQQYLVEAV